MPLSNTLCILVRDRVAFGKALSEDSLVRHHVAQSRMEINQVRRLKILWGFLTVRYFCFSNLIFVKSLVLGFRPRLQCRRSEGSRISAKRSRISLGTFRKVFFGCSSGTDAEML